MTEPRKSAVWPPVLLASAVWLVPILWLHAANPRILASWHGFLHTAVASRFPPETLPPENPFFAGEPLPYYWFYQFLAAALARVSGLDPLHALQFLVLAALAVLSVSAAWIGRRHLRSTGAGLLIGFLALAGLNPLGPLIAAAKHLVRGVPLIDAGPPLETVWVGDRMADAWMTQPLLPALYVSSDWRHGQNLVWFLDNSSRGPALALILPLLFLFLGAGGALGAPASRRHLVRWAALAAVAAVMTALNPLIGLAVCAALAAGSLVAGEGIRWRGAACVVGAALASPTYFHLFALGERSASWTSPGYAVLKAAATGTNFLLLAPLAWLGFRAASGDLEKPVRAVALAGTSLLLAVPVVHLTEGNEHNLANAAQCLLAVPAAVGAASLWGHPRCRRWLVAAVVACLATAVLTLASFAGRPSMPLTFEGGALHRDAPLEELYGWIREQTPPEAVFLVDPAAPVKMSGNVAELPAFTGRTLFTGGDSYLVRPYADAELRAEIAATAVAGRPLTVAQLEVLRDLDRPVYLVLHRADSRQRMAPLVTRYGPPAFHVGSVAVFALDLNRSSRIQDQSLRPLASTGPRS